MAGPERLAVLELRAHRQTQAKLALTEAALRAERLESARLREVLRDYVQAQSRMLEGWAEGDEAVKQTLWRNLHELESGARDLLEEADTGRRR